MKTRFVLLLGLSLTFLLFSAQITCAAESNGASSAASLIGSDFDNGYADLVSCCCGDSCGCGDSVGCGDACGSGGILGALTSFIAPTDHAFDSFISPMTNPVFFQDPRTLTELRTIFINQKIPGGIAGLPSGEVQLYAPSFRIALNKRLSIIAPKDGFIVSDYDLLDDGWADTAAGIKYVFYRDVANQQLASAGMVYEIASGQSRALQGNGNGTFHLFVSGGTQIGDNMHWVSGTGIVLPADHNDESTLIYWSNHLDYHLGGGFYVLSELNWFNWSRSGAAFGLPLEGGDLINLGAMGVAGNDIVTNAYGIKMVPSKNLELGVAWEFPLTQRKDILDNRLTVDVILRY